MELNKLSFPVKITLEEAISIFQKEFDKKGYKVKITKIIFTLISHLIGSVSMILIVKIKKANISTSLHKQHLIL